MKRLILLFILLAISSVSQAAYTGRYVYKLIAAGSFNNNYYSDLQTACNDAYNYNKANKINWYTTSGPLYMLGVICRYDSTPTSTVTIQWQQYLECSGTYINVTAGTGAPPNCSGDPTPCPPGQTFINGVCRSSCEAKKGQNYQFSINCAGNTLPGSVCLPDNCAGNLIDSFVAQNKTSSCWFGVGTAKYTGASCSGEASTSSLQNPSSANPPPEDSPETKCVKDGKSFGLVNGVPVCVPKSSTGAAPSKTTGQTDTTTTTTNPTNGQSSSTSTSEKSSVSEDGAAVSTTNTKKNEDGSTTETTTTTTKAEFCAKNPNHQICKSEPEKEEGADVCEDNPDLPQCIGLGEPEDGGAIATSNKVVSFTPVQITSGGSCPPDKSVSIAGRSITFSYSWLCQYASMFKPFMLAFAYLSAAMFLFMGLRGANT
jgi:hypothetical protein